MKRIFKDLFERQGFEDDGIFDWDILKKQKEQGTTFVPGSNPNGVGEENEVDANGNVIDKKNMDGVDITGLGIEGGNIPLSGTSSPRVQTTAAGGRPSIAGLCVTVVLYYLFFV
jgi:hypothetical protein